MIYSVFLFLCKCLLAAKFAVFGFHTLDRRLLLRIKLSLDLIVPLCIYHLGSSTRRFVDQYPRRSHWRRTAFLRPWRPGSCSGGVQSPATRPSRSSRYPRDVLGILQTGFQEQHRRFRLPGREGNCTFGEKKQIIRIVRVVEF